MVLNTLCPIYNRHMCFVTPIEIGTTNVGSGKFVIAPDYVPLLVWTNLLTFKSCTLQCKATTLSLVANPDSHYCPPITTHYTYFTSAAPSHAQLLNTGVPGFGASPLLSFRPSFPCFSPPSTLPHHNIEFRGWSGSSLYPPPTSCLFDTPLGV